MVYRTLVISAVITLVFDLTLWATKNVKREAHHPDCWMKELSSEGLGSRFSLEQLPRILNKY